MANIENLKPLTTDKAREIGSKGGKASVEAKRKRKAFKEALLLALETKKDNKTIQDIGIDALMKRFMIGDIEAFRIVRDTIGEKPTDKVDIGQDKAFEVEIKVVK